MPPRKRINGATGGWAALKLGFSTFALCLSLPIGAAQDLPANPQPTQFHGIKLFIDGGRLVTLTNNPHLLPDACRYKGRASANRHTDDAAPIDSTAAMNWYIQTSRRYQANYLLANVRYESLWAYQCP